MFSTNINSFVKPNQCIGNYATRERVWCTNKKPLTCQFFYIFEQKKMRLKTTNHHNWIFAKYMNQLIVIDQISILSNENNNIYLFCLTYCYNTTNIYRFMYYDTFDSFCILHEKNKTKLFSRIQSINWYVIHFICVYLLPFQFIDL